MMQGFWLGIAVLALLAGIAIGWRFGARPTPPSTPTRNDGAERLLQDELTRAKARYAVIETQAQNNLSAVRADMQARIDRLTADHRAELEKLGRHLADTYDELDKLRVRLAAAGEHRPPDTGQGFPATMPMQDL
jgi:hypothetical protein